MCALTKKSKKRFKKQIPQLQKPFLVNNYLGTLRFFKTNINHVIQNYFQIHQENIAVNASLENRFSGLSNNTLQMSYQDFVNYDGSLNLYLAQYPIYQKNSTQPKILRKIGYRLPRKLHSLIKWNQIESINLWQTNKESYSEWHFDAFDNFLCLFEGIKIVELQPPNSSKISSLSVLSSNYNQAILTKNIQKNIRFTLKKGDVLFIPKGWYHTVHSKGERISALNIWIDQQQQSSQNRLFWLKKNMHDEIEFQLKKFLNRKITKFVKNIDDLNKFLQNSVIQLTIPKFQQFIIMLYHLTPQQIQRYLNNQLTINKSEFIDFLNKIDPISCEILTKRLQEINNYDFWDLIDNQKDMIIKFENNQKLLRTQIFNKIIQNLVD